MFVSRNALLILGTVLCVLLYVSTSSIRLLLHHELDSKGSSLRSVRDQKENVSARDSQPERVSHSEKYVESLCAGKSNLQAGAFPSQQEKVVARTSRDLDGWLWDEELDSERKFRMKTPVSSSRVQMPTPTILLEETPSCPLMSRLDVLSLPRSHLLAWMS